jgi:hypothetical protein
MGGGKDLSESGKGTTPANRKNKIPHEINRRLKRSINKDTTSTVIPTEGLFFPERHNRKAGATIRSRRFCVYNAMKSKPNVNKWLPVNIENPPLEKYHESGRFFLKFGTAFG